MAQNNATATATATPLYPGSPPSPVLYPSTVLANLALIGTYAWCAVQGDTDTGSRQSAAAKSRLYPHSDEGLGYRVEITPAECSGMPLFMVYCDGEGDLYLEVCGDRIAVLGIGAMVAALAPTPALEEHHLGCWRNEMARGPADTCHNGDLWRLHVADSLIAALAAYVFVNGGEVSHKWGYCPIS